MELEEELAKGMFAVLAIAIEYVHAPIEWESLGKALVRIHVAEVGLHWAAEA